MRRLCRIATGLLLTIPLVGCESGEAAGTAQGNCRRLLKIFDDAGTGKIGSGAELKQRLDDDIGFFKEGTTLRKTFDSLIGAIESGDETRAARETNSLMDQCSEFAD